MSNVFNLKGFYKAENIYGKPKKSKKKRQRENQQKRRDTVLNHFGLNEYATNQGICLCIHKATGWPIPGKANQNKKYIAKFSRIISGKRKYKQKSKIKDFYKSPQWKELRYTALSLSEGSCQLCGAKASDEVQIHVDHIKPRSKYPELELDLDNIGVLCGDCNMGKSNYDEFDYRNKF